MPENLYFRQPDTQRMLLDILFIFCKLNPDLSYRQGMHEILAPILWVIERDAIDLGESSKALGEDAMIKTMFDAEYVEHDSFALFGQVMQSAKNFYEQTTTSGRENPMVARSRRIFHELLPLVDNTLSKHLESIDIVPQVFLMRWIRLLFGREFAFDEMLTLWDIIFAEDATLEIVDHICLTMLLRIHWDLIDADYNAALTSLLKYPEPSSSLPAQTFVLDALYLRNHMDQHCGANLVSKYTGRPLRTDGRPLTPPALQRNITTFSGAKSTQTDSSKGLLPRPSFQPRNFEAVLQSTAKTIYARSEKLGIGKAVRSAVDEVHKKAQEIRDHQTPSPPVGRRLRASRPIEGAEAASRRLKTLQDRNKHLSKLLEGAISELWEFQKLAAEQTDDSNDNKRTGDVERLSVAITKVQFAQVYLDDPDLPMPIEVDNIQPNQSTPSASNPLATDEQPLAPPQDPNSNEKGPMNWQNQASLHSDELADPSTFEDLEQLSEKNDAGAPDMANQPQVTTTSPDALSKQTEFQAGTHNPSITRPRLEQSSFSWMLDKDTLEDRSSTPSSFNSQNQARNRSFLFGDATGGASSTRQENDATKTSGKQSSNASIRDRDEVFDLGTLRHGKGKNG
jgi:TBC1 domain family member 5